MSNINEPITQSQDEVSATKNVLGQVAAKPYYILADGYCATMSVNFKAAKAIRLELFNEGDETVHIVDADGVEVVDAEIEAHKALAKAGFFAGARKPEVNPEFLGAFMVNDPEDPDGFAIVGDDVAALILEARDQLIEPESERELPNYAGRLESLLLIDIPNQDQSIELKRAFKSHFQIAGLHAPLTPLLARLSEKFTPEWEEASQETERDPIASASLGLQAGV